MPASRRISSGFYAGIKNKEAGGGKPCRNSARHIHRSTHHSIPSGCSPPLFCPLPTVAYFLAQVYGTLHACKEGGKTLTAPRHLGNHVHHVELKCGETNLTLSRVRCRVVATQSAVAALVCFDVRAGQLQ
eukprot:2299665-Pleurochrysis_carterae.AAC.1